MQISNQISTYLVRKHIIAEEYREVVSFGIEHIIVTLGNIMTFLGIGVLMNMLRETAFFLLVFASVRRYAGGYHATTRWRCFLYSTIIVGTSLFLIKYIYINRMFYAASSLVVGSVIIINSPVEDRNKPLNVYEVCEYRKRTVFLSTAWIVLLEILTFMKQEIFAYTVWIALVWVAVLLVMGKCNFKGENLR